MKLHQLRALVAVADYGSIIGAARALFVSQPAITKAIRELEADVGVTLLGRSVSGVTLMPAAKSLLQRARLIVHEIERAEEQMGVERGIQEGRVTIGLTALAALTLLPSAYARFRQDMPQVKAEFLEQPVSKLLDSLRQGTLDFALISASRAPADTSVHSTELATYSAVFVVRENGLLAKATSLKDLSDAEWLYIDPSDTYPLYIAELFKRSGLPAPHRMTKCTSQALLFGIALTCDSVISWPSPIFEVVNATGQFRKLDFIEKPADVKLFLIQREGAIITRPAEYFIRCVMDLAKIL
ncbi:LysR family transcriptional regulator [Glaciimonas sp. GS1]|uniref:LysR family transcriptional regulator n=2 Tax=Glaciimonas soli TaxID=2590999 RepID=A0A843YP31_9BURK|nr:LysR family transcriptional regulator [Glaciimonas soli]